MAGGGSGSAGGVGEAVGPVSEIGVTGGVVDAASGSASPGARGERERDAHEGDRTGELGGEPVLMHKV